MPLSAVRLAVGTALIPFLPGVFLVIGSALDQLARWGMTPSTFWACEACQIFAIVAWLVVWHRAVDWTPTRTRTTGLMVLIMLFAPFGAYFQTGNMLLDTWYGVLPLLALAMWFAGTGIAWRSDSPRDSAATTDALAATSELARCPSCQYSLKGLREVRCPECGWASTLDEYVKRVLFDAVEV